uniref:Uncharacterized protein n=1 Tax=Plectus sambesii TaxID=2011161 RepID=A0A914WM58_9BILA
MRAADVFFNFQKSQLQRDTQHLRAQLEDYRHGTGEQIKILEQQLCYSSKLNQRLEDVVRTNLSEGACVDAKSAAQNDVVNEKLNTSSSSSDHLLNKSGNNRAQLILELSNEISEKTDLIKRLEEDIVRRDLEIAHMKEITNTADSVMQAGHFHSKTQPTKSSGMPPPRPGSGSGQRQSFTARRVDPKA